MIIGAFVASLFVEWLIWIMLIKSPFRGPQLNLGYFTFAPPHAHDKYVFGIAFIINCALYAPNARPSVWY